GALAKWGASSVTSLAARQGSPSFLTRSVGRSEPPRTSSSTWSRLQSSLWPGMPSIHSLRAAVDIVAPCRSLGTSTIPQPLPRRWVGVENRGHFTFWTRPKHPKPTVLPSPFLDGTREG